MVAKVEIVEKLGESAVLLPSLIEEGLAANDRLKIRLTMLQEAAAQASEPNRQAPTLERERRSVGLSEPAFNDVISGARRIDADTFLGPGAELLASGIAGDLKAMIAPIEIARADVAAPLKERLEATIAALPSFKGDCVAQAKVARLASAQRGGEDSLHLLVMDLHKQLNRVASEAAIEEIDGARVYGSKDADGSPSPPRGARSTSWSARRSARTGTAPFSNSAAPTSSSPRGASPTASRSKRRQAKASARFFCATSCISPARASRTGARRGTFATRSKPICRSASIRRRASCSPRSSAIWG